MNPVLLVLKAFIHNNLWVCTYRLNSCFAFWNVAKPNLRFTSPLYFNGWPIYFLKRTSDNAWLWIYTLEVDANKCAVKNFTVLDNNSAISLGNYMDCPLIKVWKPAIRNLGVSINGKNGTGVISFISNKITPDKIIWSLRESYNCREFLF